MLVRLIVSLLCFSSSLLWSNDMLLSDESFMPYDDMRQLIVRGDVNVIMGGDSHLNVIEFDSDVVKVSQLPGGVIELSPASASRFNSLIVAPTVVVRSNNRFRDLYQLTIRDSSSLVAKELESSSLSVEVKSNGSVMIEGVMNLNYLQVTESSDVEIYWVDSHSLDVSVEQGNVVLAGRTDFLTLKGMASAEIDASGLISKRSWVSGVENANISIFPTDELFAYTRGRSIVDVKQKPKTYAALNQAPSTIVLNYVEMEQRASAAARLDR